MRVSSRIIGAAGISLALAAAVQAQTADVIGQIEDLTILDLKARNDVLQAIYDANKLAETSKPKAVERLKDALAKLNEKTRISKEEKKFLVHDLERKIKALETVSVPTADKASPKIEIEKARAENEDMTKALRKLDELVKANRTMEASQELGRLRAKYPNNPMLLGLAETNLNATSLQKYSDIHKSFAAAWVANEQNLLGAATPMTRDLAFPDKKEWDRITELRRKELTIKLSQREEAILQSLNTVVTVVVKDRPFQEAIQEFANQIKQEIHIDTKSLEDAGLDMNRRITFSGNVSARTALRALLQGQGLTYVVKDEMIQIVTLEKAEREMLTTRTYVISDLVDVGGPFSNAVQWGPVASYQQMRENADAIVKLITDSIDPKCWKDKGGFCTIQFHLPTKSIVVRASTEVHASIGGAIYGKK